MYVKFQYHYVELYMIGFKCMLVTVMLCGGFLIIDLKMDYNKKMHPSTNFLEILFIG